ncbi:MAG: hypothetical protein DRP02_02225 [Candidatus Gerdarchaeota archaeon]|nr:MAG: hypothetical protein DRP02_02225 [Candidatus Gerdarchaeota archaeon]
MQEQINFDDWMKETNMSNKKLVRAFQEECGLKIFSATVSEWRNGRCPRWTKYVDALEKITGMKIRQFKFEKKEDKKTNFNLNQKKT